MKIQTHDGKIFDVPEENLSAFLQEYNDMTGYNSQPSKGGIDDGEDSQPIFNWRGATRSFLAGAVPFADELEAAARSGQLFSGDEYDRRLKIARESRAQFAESNPELATGLTIAGGIGSALLPVGVAGQVAKGATLGAKTAAGAKTGAALGALYGFGEGQGGLENRLKSGLIGGGVGGVVGGVMPAAITGIGNSWRWLRTKPLTEAEAAEGILNSALRPGDEAERLAALYSDAARMGAKDIQHAASNLNEKFIEMQNWRNPELADTVLNPTWSSETPSAAKIMKKIKSPSDTAGTKAYQDWAKGVPELSKRTGDKITKLIKENAALKRVFNAEKKYNPDFKGSLNKQVWTHEKTKILSNRLAKSIKDDPEFKKTALNVASEKAMSQLDDILEEAAPGKKIADTLYRGGKNQQERATNIATKRIREIAQIDRRKNPEISLTGIAREVFKPLTRGMARELLRNNGVAQTISPNTLRAGSALGDSLLRTGLGAENTSLGHINAVFENDPYDTMSVPREFIVDENGNLILMEK